MNATTLLAPGSFLLLFAVGIGLDTRVRGQQMAKRRNERFRAALDRHERITFVDLSTSTGSASKAPDTRVPQSSIVFGYDVHRLDLYPYPPRIVIAVSLPLAGMIAGAGTLLLGPFGLLLTFLFWPLVTRTIFGRWRRKRASILFQQFPDALAMVVRGVRVGIPIGEAIAAVSRDCAPPTAPEFGRVVEQLAIGLPLDESLRMMAERNGLQEYRFFATALGLQSQTGGNLSETLEGLADTIRKRVAARARGYALAAEARMSANFLTALPLILFGLLWVISPNYISTLIGSHVGHLILGLTAILLGAGVLSMRFLIQKSLS